MENRNRFHRCSLRSRRACPSRSCAHALRPGYDAERNSQKHSDKLLKCQKARKSFQIRHLASCRREAEMYRKHRTTKQKQFARGARCRPLRSSCQDSPSIRAINVRVHHVRRHNDEKKVRARFKIALVATDRFKKIARFEKGDSAKIAECRSRLAFIHTRKQSLLDALSACRV